MTDSAVLFQVGSTEFWQSVPAGITGPLAVTLSCDCAIGDSVHCFVRKLTKLVQPFHHWQYILIEKVQDILGSVTTVGPGGASSRRVVSRYPTSQTTIHLPGTVCAVNNSKSWEPGNNNLFGEW
jgi:hypothetical protein